LGTVLRTDKNSRVKARAEGFFAGISSEGKLSKKGEKWIEGSQSYQKSGDLAQAYRGGKRAWTLTF